MKTIQLKKICNKASLFLVALLTFGLISGKSLAQTVNPGQNYPGSSRPDSIRMNPNDPGQNMSNPNQMPDTSHMTKGTKSKLTQSQINKIVGNDTKLNKDSQGRQLYKETSTGKQYYIGNNGTKVYIK